MIMRALLMGQSFTAMGVRVQVDLSVVMAMGMKMDLIPKKAPQNVRSKDHQHNSDRKFEPCSQPVVNGNFQQDCRATDQEQGECVSKPPKEAMARNRANPLTLACDAGDGGNVVGFQGMPHTHDET
jgi:hypothetical protein